MKKHRLLVYVCLSLLLGLALSECGSKKDDQQGESVEKTGVDINKALENQPPPSTPVETPTEEDQGEAKPGEDETEKPSQEDPKPVPQTGETALAMAATAIPNTVTLGGCFLEKGESRRGARSASTLEPPQDNVKVEKSDPTGGPQKDAITITKGDTFVTVYHALTHNCCYQATVKTSIDEHRIRVLEVLAGETCRCMCHSTITTRIDLPGPPFFKQYHITVEVDNNGTPGPTHEETVFF